MSSFGKRMHKLVPIESLVDVSTRLSKYDGIVE